MIVPESIKKDKLSTLKYQRNQLLRDSDIYMISDFPITDYHRELVKEYRQQLRDYFQLPGVRDWVFTLENQEPPVLPSFPDLTQIQIPYIEVPPIYYANIKSNIEALPITSFELSSNILVE